MKTASKIVNTHYALSYIGAMRRKVSRAPTWEDVADAYDAGLHHATHVDARARSQLQHYLQAMKVVNHVHQERRP